MVLFVDEIDEIGAAEVVEAVVVVGVDEGIASVETLGIAKSVPAAVLLVSPTAVEVGVAVGAGAVATAVALALAVVLGVADILDVSWVIVDEVVEVFETDELRTAVGNIGDTDVAVDTVAAVEAVDAIDAGIVCGSAAIWTVV